MHYGLISDRPDDDGGGHQMPPLMDSSSHVLASGWRRSVNVRRVTVEDPDRAGLASDPRGVAGEPVLGLVSRSMTQIRPSCRTARGLPAGSVRTWMSRDRAGVYLVQERGLRPLTKSPSRVDAKTEGANKRPPLR